MTFFVSFHSAVCIHTSCAGVVREAVSRLSRGRKKSLIFKNDSRLKKKQSEGFFLFLFFSVWFAVFIVPYGFTMINCSLQITYNKIRKKSNFF